MQRHTDRLQPLARSGRLHFPFPLPYPFSAYRSLRWLGTALRPCLVLLAILTLDFRPSSTGRGPLSVACSVYVSQFCQGRSDAPFCLDPVPDPDFGSFTASVPLGHAIDIVLHQDNETPLKVLAAGYSAKLRHANRVHGVNIASMPEQSQGPHVSAEYCRSELQIANGLTKIIPPAEWPHTMTQFGMTASGDGFHLDAVVASRPTDHSIPAEIFAASCPKISCYSC